MEGRGGEGRGGEGRGGEGRGGEGRGGEGRGGEGRGGEGRGGEGRGGEGRGGEGRGGGGGGEGTVECVLISDPCMSRLQQCLFVPTKKRSWGWGGGRRVGEKCGRGTLNTPPSNHFISQYLPRGQTHVQSKGHMFLL